MDLEKEVKKIDAEFIRLIIAGEFKLVGIGEHITTIECGGFYLNLWNDSEDHFGTYHNGFDHSAEYDNCYMIHNMSKKRAAYRAMISVKDPKAESQLLKLKRAQLAKLKKELGEE